jgi:probable F420-dependent oxidoreductase
MPELHTDPSAAPSAQTPTLSAPSTLTTGPRTTPRIGVGLPVLGEHAGPESVRQIASAAERLSFSSVSTCDRLLLPLGADWGNVYGLPDFWIYDVLESLTWVAGQTQRVKLVTGVLNTLFQPPIVLARRLATLDHLSGGRVVAGIGLGWMPEELVATGVPAGGRGARFEEHLAAMRACWGPNPVEHAGPRYTIPRSKVGAKPVNGAIPVLIGGVTQPAIARAARLGDGVILAFRDWDSFEQQLGWYREAGGTGEVIVRAGPMLADQQHAVPPTTWTEPSILDDLARISALGVAELIWDLNIIGMEPRQQIAAFERLASALDW